MAMTMDKGQRTKDKGHRISQSVIKNKIGMTKYGIKILVWNLPCRSDLVMLKGEVHFFPSSDDRFC